jgi:hypothetical protein
MPVSVLLVDNRKYLSWLMRPIPDEGRYGGDV